MPKTIQKKHSFEAQVQSALVGARIVPQGARRETERESQPEAPSKTRTMRQPEALLVEKLIDFLKAMD